MPADSVVEQLLQEALDSDLTPEEVCAEHPELLWEVREQWRRCRNLNAELEAIFPSSHGLSPGELRAPLPSSDEFPHLPGYEVKSILGHGGMGVVYKAKQLKLNRPVAIKMLISGRFAAKSDITRFIREAEAIAALRHPNVVQIHDIGDFEGRPYLTMEFMEGGTLAEKLAGAPQPSSQAVETIIGLARGVQVAHGARIVHRDLKPANILLDADGTPKLADFGLARHFEGEAGLTLTGMRLGTPSYMAPEQAMGKASSVGPSADIYSLGAILYEMLTGRPPFRGETASDTERQVLSQSPVPPSRLNGKVSRDLETICLKCLSKEPTRRYASANDLIDDLDRFQQGLPIRARRPGPVERLTKWARRQPALAVVAGFSTLFAIVLIAAAVTFTDWRTRQRHAVERELQEAQHMQQLARWDDAAAALGRAEERLSGLASRDLNNRLEYARHNLAFVIELDRVRLTRLTSGNLAIYKAQADQDYAEAFEHFGVKLNSPAEATSSQMRASAVRTALLAALDDWAVCTADPKRRQWLLAVARKSDPDENDWRDRARDPNTWDDAATLADLASSVSITKEPVSLQLALAERLADAKGDSLAFIRKIQLAHPADFWANMTLGNEFMRHVNKANEAAGYFRAAVGCRPKAAVAYNAVGDTMRRQRRFEEAIAYYEGAIALDARYARAHTNLGMALKEYGQPEAAIESYERALADDANYALAHFEFANLLSERGQFDEAIAHYQRVLELEPDHPEAPERLEQTLLRQRRAKGDSLLGAPAP